MNKDFFIYIFTILGGIFFYVIGVFIFMGIIITSVVLGLEIFFNQHNLNCIEIQNKIELHKQVPLTAQEAIHAKRTTT